MCVVGHGRSNPRTRHCGSAILAAIIVGVDFIEGAKARRSSISLLRRSVPDRQQAADIIELSL